MRRCTPFSPCEQPVRVPALDDERRRRDAGLRALLDLVELDVEAAPLRPAHVHAQQHLGPVLRVGAAGARVHLADRVALVVLAGEQRPQLELVELADDAVDAGVDLRLDRVVALLAAELVQRLEVGQPLLEAVDELDVVAHASELGRDLARLVRVVPQVGPARLLLELGQPLPRASSIRR